MTSRLQRKLDRLDEEGNNLNESFCLIGTPLPSLADTKKDKNEFVPVWQQEVRDEQGRRRFHGAFTGGFSAGYFNTVGSKEGWTPSTFISSRSARASSSKTQQRAEDFMDEEDLAEMRDSRKLENTETFRSGGEGGSGMGLGGTAEELGAGGGIFGNALTSLIQPSSSSIGQKLLIKMGWKPGQGVGPRLTARQVKLQERKERQRVGGGGASVRDRYGAGGNEDDDGDAVMAGMEGSEGGKKHTFAPRDSKLLIFEPKQDQAGLGYIKGAGIILPGIGAGPAAGKKDASGEMSMNISQGFGLGGNDADEDDLDVYDTTFEARAERRDDYNIGGGAGGRMTLDDDGDDDMEGVILLGEGAVGRSKSRDQAAKRGREEDQQIRRRKEVQQKQNQGQGQGRVWHDGRPVIAGFVVDLNPVLQDKWFDFPDIPEGWRPRPARVWQSGKKRWDQKEVKVEEPVVPLPGRRPQMTADQRGEVLGEQQLAGSAKSIFDYLSEKSKERLAQVAPSAGKSSTPEVGVTLEAETPASPAEGVIVPPLSPRTAGAALKGFIPFGDDLPKQERYVSYLRSQTLNSEQPSPKLLPGKRIDDINKELSDFSKSAQMFRPMSFAMANRFTSSKVSAQDMIQPKPGLHIPDPEKLGEWKDQLQIQEEIKEILTPREEAARKGLWGKMTRSTVDWAPNALVCKRFGVVNPWPEGMPGGSGSGSGGVGAAGAGAGQAGGSAQVGKTLGTKPLLTMPGQDLAWQNNFINQQHQPEASGSSTQNLLETGEGAVEPKERQPRTLAEVGMADDENQGRETLSYKKPEIDIFKAIFASDDEDSDGSDDEGGPVTSNNRPSAPVQDQSTGSPTEFAAPFVVPAPNLPLPSAESRPVFNLSRNKDLTSESSPAATDDDDAKKKSKKDKKRDRKKAKNMLSFDVGDEEDEDGEGSGRVEEEERERKRRKKDKDGKDRERGRDRRIEVDGDVAVSTNGSGSTAHRVATAPAAPVEDDDDWVEKEVVVPRGPMAKRARPEDFF